MLLFLCLVLDVEQKCDPPEQLAPSSGLWPRTVAVSLTLLHFFFYNFDM